jgi:hypothetical protein
MNKKNKMTGIPVSLEEVEKELGPTKTWNADNVERCYKIASKHKHLSLEQRELLSDAVKIIQEGLVEQSVCKQILPPVPVDDDDV